MSEWWEKRFVDFSTLWIIAHDLATTEFVLSVRQWLVRLLSAPLCGDNFFVLRLFFSTLYSGSILNALARWSLSNCCCLVFIEHFFFCNSKKIGILFHLNPIDHIFLSTLFRDVYECSRTMCTISLAANVVVITLFASFLCCRWYVLTHYAIRSNAWIARCFHFHLRAIALLFSVASNV